MRGGEGPVPEFGDFGGGRNGRAAAAAAAPVVVYDAWRSKVNRDWVRLKLKYGTVPG